MAAGAGARPAPRWLKALTEPLSAAQLRRLEEHRYTAAGVSLLEPPLQLYWTWLLQWIPLWMAPNSITLLGLAINMLTTLVLISYCPTVTEEVGLADRPPPAGPQLLPTLSRTPAQVRPWRLPGRRTPPTRARGRAARVRGGVDTASTSAPRPPRAFSALPGDYHAPTQSRVYPQPPPDGGGALKVTAQSRPPPGRRTGCLGHCERGACLSGRRPILRQVGGGGGQAVGDFAHWSLNTPSSVPPGLRACGLVDQARNALWTLLYLTVCFSKAVLVIL